MMKKKKNSGVPVWLTLVLSVLGIAIGISITGYSYIREKYAGSSHPNYSRQLMVSLDENSLTYKIASTFYSADELEELKNPSSSDSGSVISDGSQNIISSDAVSADTNGDGIEIQHVYGNTYEGYMMVIHDPEDVFIALNPGMSTGASGPKLPEYIETFDAIAGINGGGFLDSGGTGDGSVPAGIVISDGKIVQDGTSSVIAFTADHKLIATTASASALLEMGVEEAITFGPTFIHNGQNVYTAQSDLNMLNPRTAVGMLEDGTLLLLVVDGRGPSSWGAKYEDILQIFLDYGAVEAGNLDGGNSSVMMYNGKYVNYPVSMYGSRRLPDAILVRKGGRKNG